MSGSFYKRKQSSIKFNDFFRKSILILNIPSYTITGGEGGKVTFKDFNLHVSSWKMAKDKNQVAEVSEWIGQFESSQSWFRKFIGENGDWAFLINCSCVQLWCFIFVDSSIYIYTHIYIYIIYKLLNVHTLLYMYEWMFHPSNVHRQLIFLCNIHFLDMLDLSL